jgi:cytochrome c-type biogenesis protein CcmF
MELSGYKITFEGIDRGREPHREWKGSKLTVTSPSGQTETLTPRMNFYERSTDPIGTPAVRSAFSGDLYVSLMAFDEKVESASLKVWTFPLVGWIWGALPMFILGSLISLWPSRKARVSVAAAPSRPSVAPAAGDDLSRGAA